MEFLEFVLALMKIIRIDNCDFCGKKRRKIIIAAKYTEYVFKTFTIYV